MISNSFLYSPFIVVLHIELSQKIMYSYYLYDKKEKGEFQL